MKKNLIIVLSMLLCVAMCACGTAQEPLYENSGEAVESTESSEQSTQTSSEDPVSTPDNNTSNEDANTSDEDNVSNDDNTSDGENTDNDGETSKDEPVVPEVKNEYVSANTNYKAGQITLRPKHIYWNDGVLVAECYVINGFDKTVQVVKVDKLTLYTKAGVIAEDGFSLSNPVVLPTHTNGIVTFRFSGSTVKMLNADLTGGVETISDVSYKS